MDPERARTILAWTLGILIAVPAVVAGEGLSHIVASTIDLPRPEAWVPATGIGFSAGVAIGVMVGWSILHGRPPLRGIVVGGVTLAVITALWSALDAVLGVIVSDAVFFLAAIPSAGILLLVTFGAGWVWLRVYGSRLAAKDDNRLST